MLGKHMHNVITSLNVNTCRKLTGRFRDTNEQNRKLKKRVSELQSSQRQMANARFVICIHIL